MWNEDLVCKSGEHLVSSGTPSELQAQTLCVMGLNAPAFPLS